MSVSTLQNNSFSLSSSLTAVAHISQLNEKSSNNMQELNEEKTKLENPLLKSPLEKVKSNSASSYASISLMPPKFPTLPSFAISNTFSWHPWQKRIVSFLIQKPKRNVILLVIDGVPQYRESKNHHAGKTFLAHNFKKMFPEETVILKCAKKLEMQVVAEQSPNRKVVFLDAEDKSAHKKLPKSAYRAIEEFQKEIPTHFVIFSRHELKYNLFPDHTFLVFKLYPLSPPFKSAAFTWTEYIIKTPIAK